MLQALGAWMVLQAAIALSGFYLDTTSLPPHMALAMGPPLIAIAFLLARPAGRRWSVSLDLRVLTWLHVVRLPVEWGLHRLYLEGLVPQVMTFEGRNFDLFSGLTAPLLGWTAFGRNGVRRPLLIAWNVLCLGLLGMIVFHGVLSLPTPFQRFGFEQPNTGLLVFPFIWLPAVIVPAVLFAHLVALYRLIARTG